MESAWDILAVVGGPLLAIAGTLLGIIVGSRITRSDEHKQWLRNEKIKLYSEWMNTFGNIQFDNVFRAMGEVDAEREQGTEIFEFYNRIHEMCMRVILVAPQEIVTEVEGSMNSIQQLWLFHSNLPGEMRAKYLQAGGSEWEKKVRSEAMLKDIHKQLTDKVTEHVMDGYKRLETVTNLMRDDLRVAESVPKGMIARLGLGKSSG